MDKENINEVVTEETQDNTNENKDVNIDITEDTITLSKADYNKAIQAAEDRLRTKYSKTIKALEDKVAELTPAVKSDAELEIERRLAEVERKEQESAAKEKAISLKASLQKHNIDTGIADYLTPDIDVEAFSADIEKIISARMASAGYKPSGHQNNQPISKSDYDNMTYDEKVELYHRDPSLWKSLRNK